MENAFMYTAIRVFHADCMLPEVNILVGNRVIAEHLGYAKTGAYKRVGFGVRKISVVNPADNEELYSETILLEQGAQITLVLFGSFQKKQFYVLTEKRPGMAKENGYIRAINLNCSEEAYDLLNGAETVFQNMSVGLVTTFLPACKGDYELAFVKSTDCAWKYQTEGMHKEIEKTDCFMRVVPGKNYTVCLLGGGIEAPAEIKVLEY